MGATKLDVKLVPKRERVRRMGKLKYERYVVRGIESGGFNGAIHPLSGGRFLLVYRTTDRSLSAARLDAQYVAQEKVERLPLFANEDPRIFEWEDNLYMSTCYAGPVRQEIWPLYPSRAEGLIKDNFHFYFDEVENFPGYSYRWEKNWQPLPRSQALFFEYSICPRRIVQFDPFRNRVRLAIDEQWELPARYRQRNLTDLRLSVPSVYIGNNKRLGIFHFKNDAWHYFAGFYTFDQDSWKIQEMSGAPAFDASDAYGRVAGIRLVFPQSMQIEDDLVRIAGGSNDASVIVFHLSLKEILASLDQV